MNTSSSSRERAAALLLAGLVLLQFLPAWLRGLTPFWGDLTYLHHPWRSLPAQLVQAGRLPLWNPYVYFGMPMAASMQGALFYPATVPFYVFGFATATALYHLFHYWLAGWLMFLWLRSLRLSCIAALAGAAAYCLGGTMLSRMPFLNHLAVLSLGPAFLLFFSRRWLLALALALAFLAGYPLFMPGLMLAAWLLRLILAPRQDSAARWRGAAAAWAAGGLLAAGLTACVFLPAAELAANCRRSGGMDLAETLLWGFEPKDLARWVSPLLAPGRFDPAVEWWKSCHVGLAGSLAVVAGLLALSARKAAALAAFLAAVGVLILGKSNAFSQDLWAGIPALRFVRYPGNLAYLAWPVLAVLVAAGVESLRRAASPRGRAWLPALAAALVAVELSAYACGSMPLADRGIFASAGPLVRRLQRELGTGRYLMSPLALEEHKGSGVMDWKWRLYGLTNAPFRLAAGGNFGEPLVPKGSYDFMDLLYSQRSVLDASRLLKWGGIGVLLTPKPIPPGQSGALRRAGRELWELYAVDGAARAYWLDGAAGRALPEGLPAGALPAGRPLRLAWEREDRFVVEGEAPADGWVFVAEPRYPGWKAALDGAPVEAAAALGAFQKLPVPRGPFRLSFRYDPSSFRLGVAVTVLCMMGFCLYWYNRLLDNP
ncbi:MAG: hypothetical protein HY927_06025 [Elusimicrobia bacterium]|nr:hypothetical protein [Elusimicrobiota bacterium]